MNFRLVSFLSLVYCFSYSQTNSQNSVIDSLQGFNEKLVLEQSVYEGITEEELPMYLNYSKRNFIKGKYNLKSDRDVFIYPDYSKIASSNCINEDFESSGLGTTTPTIITITNPTGISGWQVTDGLNQGTDNSCLLNGCCTGTNVNGMELIGAGAYGYIDPIIGSSYPIYSIFGNTPNYGSSIYGFNSYGDWLGRINKYSGSYTITKATKTLLITANNAKFKFAYLAVIQSSHCCCTSPGLTINFKDCTGKLLTGLNQYSVTVNQASYCSYKSSCSTPNPIKFQPASSIGWNYSKWQVDSVDFSSFIGSCVNIEFIAYNCNAGGHKGYAYFDANCGALLSTNIESNSNTIRITLFPNPNEGSFNLEMTNEIPYAEFEIRNILGQIVHTQIIKKGTNRISAFNLPNGIYTYSILKNKELIKTDKLIIE